MTLPLTLTPASALSLKQPFVSIIIPVFNDVERLQCCLEKLEHQTYPQHLYEVLVVDNGSSADQNIAEAVVRFKQVRLTSESYPGSYAARNKGIELARGAVIGFTDADCLPALDWIERGVTMLLQHPDCGFVAGKIDLFFQDEAEPTAVELYESLWYPLSQQEFVESHHFGATANIFTFAEVIHQVGRFNHSLKSSGDREWGQRVYRSGYRPIYEDALIVQHPTRHSLSQLYRRARRIIGGRYSLLQQEPSWLQRHGKFIVLLGQYLLAPIPMTGFNLLCDRRLKTLKQKVGVTLVMDVVCAIYVWELIRLKFGALPYRG
ncbi:MAG: glycosyltransferase family A protein [Cyanobacteriota bacterium]|nr:glycosyltransferase family A protein [Cyanobacteriota bacterium]